MFISHNCPESYLNYKLSSMSMKETICLSKSAVMDLVRVKEEFDSIIESIELMGNKGFMNSYNKAKIQIKNKKFADWNAL